MNNQDPFQRTKEEAANRDSKDRRAVEHVRHFMKKSDEYRTPHLALVDQAREMYAVWDRQAKSPIQRANLQLPYAYLIVQSELPLIVQPFLKEKPYFKIKGRKVVDMQWDGQLTDFVSMQLDKANFAPRFVSFTSDLLRDGTAVAKVPYKYREEVVTKRYVETDPVYGFSYPAKKKEVAVLFDGPDFEPIKLEDFFPDWSSALPGDVESMRGCVHRTYKTLNELKGSGKYKNLEELERSLGSRGADAWADPYYKGEYTLNEDKLKDKRKPLEVWEFWGLFDLKGDGEFEECIITVVNGDVVVRCEENFYDYKLRPFVAAVNVPQGGEFYGVSELFAVRGLIKESTALRNARLDQINLAVNRMFVVDRASGINAKSLYMRPSGIIYTNDMNGIRALEPPEVPSSAFSEVREIGNEISTVSGTAAGPQLTEAGRVFGRSATGASLVSNIAASRAGVKILLLSELFFSRLAKLILLTDAQFVSEDQWIKVSDPNAPNPFAALPTEAFHCDYDFDFVTNAESDSQTELGKLQQFAQIAQVAEGSQPGVIKWDVVFESIGKTLLGREVKRFTRSPEELQQMQLQKLAAEQAVNAAAGAAAPQPNAGQGGPLV